ncbi:MAG: thiolase family protein [Bifidobacteriaceae bacterium]|jgi:acetyl-CoA acyltransferase|nr:thiolase family protein [Bifidobacteriaceae bacterium]
MGEAVVVAYGRCAVTRGIKGSLAGVNPVDFGAETLSGVLARVPGLDPAVIDDVIVGCALPESKLGLNPARNIALRAGLPEAVSGQTVNRFCSSGLQALAHATASIRAGFADVIVAGGVEHMSSPVLSEASAYLDDYLLERTQVYAPMGVTAENVAAAWRIGRAEMDLMAVESHARAARARSAGRFNGQIVPVAGLVEGEPVTVTADECIRPGTTADRLATLAPAFIPDGLVTAGNSSPRSDGAAFLVLTSATAAASLDLEPLARLTGFAVAGVAPEQMGIGPVAAVPKLTAQTRLRLGDFDTIELTEAFAAQVLAVLAAWGLTYDDINPDGGALALGHPLGATGAVLAIKAVERLRAAGGGRALVTMCIGGGMGAAGALEVF